MKFAIKGAGDFGHLRARRQAAAALERHAENQHTFIVARFELLRIERRCPAVENRVVNSADHIHLAHELVRRVVGVVGVRENRLRRSRRFGQVIDRNVQIRKKTT
ncbi:hypothetical protein U27_03195 [Candidatus Vecturithrix granuli]|uniref:Uncharacterized protein n=1 Tax=Vecturithrix granuli TaxID=1499967 RepID=A0A081BV78_VECG1|nr:hypothetical protein U27_03195 [Candidatus Vecturithrix granuli]